MEVEDPWRHALASWRTVAGIVFVSTVAALAFAFLMPVSYRAETLLAPQQDEMSALGGLASQFGGIAQLAGLNVEGENNRAAFVATLKSRALTQSYIEDEHLVPILFWRKWDAAKRRWRNSNPQEQPTPWDAFRLFDRKVRVVQDDRRSGLVTLVITWRDPNEAARWANDLVTRANAKLQAQEIDESQRTINFLQAQLGDSSSLEVRQLLYRLIEVEAKKISVARARDEFAFRVIDPAVAPRRHYSPNRPLVVGSGFVLGVMLSAAVVVAGAAPPRTRELRFREGRDPAAP